MGDTFLVYKRIFPFLFVWALTLFGKIECNVFCKSLPGEICPFNGHWVDQRWVSANCLSDPPPSMAKSGSTSPKRPKNQKIRVIFFGDSTTHRLVAQFKSSLKCIPIRQQIIERCGLVSYLGFSRKAEGYVKPNPFREGPKNYGVKNPYCSDCSSCHAEDYDCPDFLVEYLPVEFLRDVEIQTEMSNLTQVNVAHYLERKNVTFDFGIVNIGLHDAVLNITDKVFIQNVIEYLGYIRLLFHQIVWILPSKMLIDPKYSQQYALNVVKRNRLMKPVLQQHGVVVLDAYKISELDSLHIDTVHLNTTYYSVLSNILINYLTGSCKDALNLDHTGTSKPGE